MVAGIIAHIIDFTENNPGYKWLIYMTNQVGVMNVNFKIIIGKNSLSHRGLLYSPYIIFSIHQ